MSERNVKLFYNEMCKNEKLQNEIKEVLSRAKTESDKQALLNDIAKKYHFDFTPEEAKKFAENLSRKELSLDDLSDVSGGFGRKTAIFAFTALTALGSLGSAGAIVSHADKVENVQNQESGKEASAGVGIIEEEDTQDQEKKEDKKQKEEEDKAANEAEDSAYEGMRKMIETAEARQAEEKEEKEMLDNLGKIAEEDAAVEAEDAAYKGMGKMIEDAEKDAFINNSDIISEDNINLFEGLVCPTQNLRPLYKMSKDGGNRESMQNKLRGHSNIVVLVKTDEGKIFGGYTSCKIEYNNEWKLDNKAFLFSIDLNEKFNTKENRSAINDSNNFGIRFGNSALALFYYYNDGCSSFFENKNSYYETNGITTYEFCGGKEDEVFPEVCEFNPVEIEIFEIKEEQNEQEDIKRRNEDNEANKKNMK